MKWTRPIAAALAIAAAPLFVQAAGAGWTDNMAAALEQAKAENKDVLIDFTGSDWCSWCVKLDEEVFSQDDFKAYAGDEFVLVEMDFPQNKPIAEDVKQQNAEWSSKLAVQGFPTIALVDADGKAYAMTGYQPGGAEAYVAHLEQLKAQKAKRDAAMAAAAEAEGVEKARLLDEALQAVGPQLAAMVYADQIEQIIALDADNAAGLKEQYEPVMEAIRMQALMMRIMPMLQTGDFAGADARIDQILAEEDITTQARQFLTATKAQIAMQTGDLPASTRLIDEAIAIDPDSEIASALTQARQQLEQVQQAPQAPEDQ